MPPETLEEFLKRNPQKTISDYQLNDDERENLFKDLMGEAVTTRGNTVPLEEFKDIPWANTQLAKEGQEFARKNMFAMFSLGKLM